MDEENQGICKSTGTCPSEQTVNKQYSTSEQFYPTREWDLANNRRLCNKATEVWCKDCYVDG